MVVVVVVVVVGGGLLTVSILHSPLQSACNPRKSVCAKVFWLFPFHPWN
jgi:hypothetical protein